jgi:small subunit ribosomal protein S8|tara:strand:+ start:550 stop:942 length:393 start_codon:yes stop_codon:yes gene_type:complete
MMTDPIADMLTRIRNANLRKHPEVAMPSSKMKASIAQVLQEEGFVNGVQVEEDGVFRTLKIQLRYWQGEPVIRKIVRISKPGLRQYTKAGDLRFVVNGQGVAIVSTSKGVMADRQCRSEGIGGELLCEVW